MSEEISPITHLEKVIAGEESPVTHLEKIIALYGGTGGSGGSGTTNYNALLNKPSINGVELSGNKTLAELGVVNYDDSQVKQMINNLNYSKQEKKDVTLDTTDKTVVGAINEINGSQLDTVGFSSDYKNIILNRKNGLNPYTIPIASIIHNAKIIELNDIDSTNIGDGKTLVYDGATKKHKYVESTGTDELVKMDSTTDAKYLSDLIDKQTVINDNGVLKVKKLDGQDVTITEINYLKGLTMNVMDLVNAFANGGVKVLNTPVNTYADLSTLDRSTFIDGISYIVYVLADENHSGAKTTYLVDKTNTTFFGNADSQRNFTTDPINLANEVTGKLGTANIDVDALWKLLTINDTYKTLTSKNEVFGTHGAKAMYDELNTELGKKANSSDLATHTSDTNIHVNTTDKDIWNTVTNKIDKSSITTTVDGSSTDKQVPSAKAIYSEFSDKIKDFYVNVNTTTELSKYGVDDITKLTSLLSLTSKLPVHSRFTIQINNSYKQTFYDCGITPTPKAGLLVITINDTRSKAIFTTDDGLIYASATAGSLDAEWRKWRKVCTTTVEDTGVINITFNPNDNYEAVNNNCKYFIKNGICTIFLYIKCKTPNTRGITVGKVPKALNFYIVNTIVSTSDYTFLKCSVNAIGSLQINGGTEGTTYRGVITYPVE